MRWFLEEEVVDHRLLLLLLVIQMLELLLRVPLLRRKFHLLWRDYRRGNGMMQGREEMIVRRIGVSFRYYIQLMKLLATFGRASILTMVSEDVTLSDSHDHTIDEFPIPKVPFFLRLRESISSTCHILNVESSDGSRIL